MWWCRILQGEEVTINRCKARQKKGKNLNCKNFQSFTSVNPPVCLWCMQTEPIKVGMFENIEQHHFGGSRHNCPPDLDP